MFATPRTALAGLATAAVIAGGALVAGAPAQASATSTTPTPPGATIKTVTLCVSAPARDHIRRSTVRATSWQRGVYSLDSVQVTNTAGCGNVVLGSTGHVHFSAEHVTSWRIARHLCVRVVYRADMGTRLAASVVSGSTINGHLRFVRKTTFRC
jgi:hypothetical protein